MGMMQPRTLRQKQILDYITSFIDRHGYEPSYAQIARHFQISSKATIAKHVAALERQGLITRQRAEGAFSLSLTVEAAGLDSIYEVPLLGRVAAGAPLESFVDESEPIFVPRFMLSGVRPDRVYALKVRGDSMIDEHICDGDIALIENRTEARNGEIVVALVDETQSTLKRFYRQGAEIELRPANSHMEPFRLAASRVVVQGIFRGLLRPSN
jgi:repressor LexA